MINNERHEVQLPLMRSAAKALGISAVEGNFLKRDVSDVLLKEDFLISIKKLNPNLSESSHKEALRTLERLLARTNQDNLVETAKKMLEWIKGTGQVKDEERKQKSVKLIDFENPENNTWIVAYEVTYKGSTSREVRFDGVIYCNGIPFVIAEFKSNTDPNTSWFSAATDLAEGYTQRAPAMMACSLLNIATDGRELRYGAVNAPAARFQAWGSTKDSRPSSGFLQVKYDWSQLTSSVSLLSFAQDLILHVTDKTTSSLMRIVPRWPQAEAAPLAAERALSKTDNKGLFDHFQGSGKTYAMAMAANIITRKDPKHCVILVVDRLDLLSQHQKDFAASDVRRSIIEATTSSILRESLKLKTTSGIIITTVHRFDESNFLSDRSDITVMVDEAHRSQEGSLGIQMRNALPNATLLGFTGTPLSKGDKNTFETFGSDKDKGRVVHRYSAADSVRDGTTVPLTILPREIVQKLNNEELEKVYEAYVEENNLSLSQKNSLAAAVTRADKLFKDPRRIDKVSQDVAKYMKEEILPAEYAGMLIVVDREACVLYAEKLKSLLGEEAVTAVISSRKNDPEHWDEYIREASEESSLLKDFRDPSKPIKLLVVTSKLLTGFDAKNCGVVFVEKPMKHHTLFQAVTRANRTWTSPSGAEKKFGIVIDYCGIKDSLVEAFDSRDDDPKITAFMNPEKLRAVFKRSLTAAEKVFGPEFEWNSSDTLQKANSFLHSDTKVWDIFKKHVLRASGIWEVLSKDINVVKEKDRLLALIRILHSYAPRVDSETTITYSIHGAAVLKLIYENTSDPEQKELESLTLTASKIKELLKRKEDPSSRTVTVDYSDVLDKIRERLERRIKTSNSFEYKSISERLENFKYTHYELDLVSSQQATIDLTVLVKDLKEIDRVIGANSDDLDFDLAGKIIPVVKMPVIMNPATALQDVLKSYYPAQVSTVVDELSEFLDESVNRNSYKHLKNSISAQKKLKQEILWQLGKMKIVTVGKGGREKAEHFIDALIEYVNAWMI